MRSGGGWVVGVAVVCKREASIVRPEICLVGWLDGNSFVKISISP